ncbi:hypothetical protein JCM10213_001208 [Rhodosporidiobolus nylandii]
MASASPASGSKPSLAVVLLQAEGDQFNDSLIQQREEGGRLAAAELHRILGKEVASAGEGGELLVYLVADGRKLSRSSRPTSLEAFLQGLAGAAEPTVVASPCEGHGGSAERILQLLSLYLPLGSTSRIFLGGLHTNYLAEYLEGLPAELRGKVTLLSTVTVAPKIRKLVSDGYFAYSDALEGLFGELGGAESETEEVALEDGEKQDAWPEDVWDVEQERASTASASTEQPKKRMLSDTLSPYPLSSPAPAVAAQSDAGDLAACEACSSHLTAGNGKKKRSGKSEYSGVKGAGAKVAPGLLPRPTPVPSGPFKPPSLNFSTGTPPCNAFYLAPDGCRKMACSFSHSFPFTAEEWKRFPLAVAAQICSNRVHGKCNKGDACIKGHRCPYTVSACPHGAECYYLQAGLPHSVKL